jgi:CubicO group peptidase (beta-lactamase class C family)
VVISPALESFADELAEDVRVGLTAGVQAVVRHEGRTALEVSFGKAAPSAEMTHRTIHNLYCGLKPLSAFVVARVLERHGLTVDVPLVRFFAGQCSPELTARHLLSHSAGLGAPLAFQLFFLPDEERSRHLTVQELLNRASVNEPCYSEVAAWHVLGLVVEALENRAAAEVAAGVLQTLGLTRTFLTVSEDVEDIGFYFDHDCDPPLPLLHDALPRFRVSKYPFAVGGYTTMTDLASWYEMVLRVLAGSSIAGLPTSKTVRDLVRPARARTSDPVLRRDCSFGSGVMTHLSDHFFGPMPGEHAFGHSGFLGNSFAFADPEHHLVMAVFSNGIVGRSMPYQVRRPRQVFAVYEALGLSNSSAAPKRSATVDTV